MLIRQFAPYVVLAIMFGPFWAMAMWFVMMMSFGFFMGAAFAPNHKGMPLIAKDSNLDFFSRQVLTSRNIKGSWLKDNLMGGLNYQVEHHLFPSMARPYLRKAHEIVSEYCRQNDVTMVEMNLLSSYKMIMQHLNKVGLSNNVDPFVCPMVAELRPRN
jgi:fatty acid desaturase